MSLKNTIYKPIDYLSFLKEVVGLLNKNAILESQQLIDSLCLQVKKNDDLLGQLTCIQAQIYFYFLQLDYINCDKQIHLFDKKSESFPDRENKMFLQLCQRFYNVKSVYFQRIQAFDLAILFNKKAIDTAVLLDDIRSKVNTLVNLGNLYFYEKQFEKARDTFSEALLDAENLKAFNGKNIIYYGLASNESELGRHELAHRLFDKAISWADIENNLKYSSIYLCKQADNCLQAPSLFDEVKKILDKARALIHEQEVNQDVLSEYRQVTAKYHIQQKQYKKALQILTPYLKEANLTSFQHRIKVNQLFTKIFIGLNDSENAFKFHEIYCKLQENEYQNARSIYFSRQEQYLDGLQSEMDDSKRTIEEEVAHRNQLERDKKAIEALTKKTLEQKAELQATADKLAVLNENLSHFNRMVAHDLQEPLRTIGSFTKILVKENKDTFKEGSHEYIHFITGASQRMTQMISGLLTLSRIGFNNTELVNIDLNLLVETTKIDLRNQIERTNASVTILSLPPILGVPETLKLLFQNLISNALKFIPKTRKPNITVGHMKTNEGITFFVRDNGIGISQENQNRIFDTFTRLHGREDYEGSGLGLATCKKIIEQHKGEIWVDSKLNVGTTFFFTLSD